MVSNAANETQRLLTAQASQIKGTSVVLRNISWQQYEGLLKLLERSASHLAYDDGLLEIMTPPPDHEYFSDSLADAVKDIADELDMDYDCYGSATWRRELKKAGVEPDQCFYLQNEPLVRGQLEFDLST
ncbi:MAG: Uma2 family endonuclease, partial [Cyanobacteria bacterium P01_A01_bin.135]